MVNMGLRVNMKKITNRDMEKEPLKSERVVVLMTPDEVRAIDDWSFANRIRSRAEAVRELARRGLAAPEPKGKK